MLACMTAPRRLAPALLRYRFDGFWQARRHVHVLEGRQLLFFPHLQPNLRDGQGVVLELCFNDSDQTAQAAGTVHSVETSGVRGAWLELFSLRLLEGLGQSMDKPRRKHRRLAADAVMRLERPGAMGSIARLADVSSGGARLVGVSGMWRAGTEIFLSELKGPPLRGTVIWAREGQVALSFARADAQTRKGVQRLLDGAVPAWSKAAEARHPAGCGCGVGGTLVEPLLPRAAHRRVEGL